MSDEQIEYWNGPAAARWIQYQAALDHALRSFGNAALEMAAARSGERVLDVGCGCGDSSIALAQQVGPLGSVTGVDLSASMLERARERSRGVSQLQLIQVDAAEFRPEPANAPLDLIFSRFGVMFFRDPSAAFRHLHDLLRNGGRLAFVCWRGFADNAWASLPVEVARRLLPSAAALPSDDSPGPYAFADALKLRQWLEAGGFRDLHIERYDATVMMASDLQQAVDFAIYAGPAARLLQGIAPELEARIRAELTTALTPHRVDGGYGLSGSSWLVSASA